MMKTSHNRIVLLLTIFSVAMACLESAVVVYLRLLYYPNGFDLLMTQIPANVLFVEIGREAATMVMLVTIAMIAARKFKLRFACFIFCFGVWDLFYYIWLKILINWPQAWLEWDILFLIPTVWVAPWLAPAIISVCMTGAALMVIYYPERFTKYILKWPEWLIILISMLIILFTFFFETNSIITGRIPEYYPWWLFIIGVLPAMSVILKRLLSKTTGLSCFSRQ